MRACLLLLTTPAALAMALVGCRSASPEPPIHSTVAVDPPKPAPATSASSTEPEPKPEPEPGAPTKPKAAQKTSVTPEQFCAHVTKILVGEGATLDKELKQQLGAGCISNAKKEQESDPDGYACDAECTIKAKTFADIQACSGKCK